MMGKGIGKVQRKILEYLIDKPHFRADLVKKVGVTSETINNSVRRLRMRGYKLVRFRPPSSKSKKKIDIKPHPPTIYYYEKDKLEAYKMLMSRVGDRVYNHWISIGKPMLGDMIVHGEKGYKVVDDGNR